MKTENTKTGGDTAMAEALTDALNNATPTAAVTTAAAILAAGVDADEHGNHTPERLGSVASVLSEAIFSVTLGKTVYPQKDRAGSITGYSKKVADLLVRLGDTGLMLRGSISVVQNIGQEKAGYRLSFHYNADTKTSALFLEGETAKEALEKWKDDTIAQFIEYCKINKLDLFAKDVQQQRITAGGSLI